MRAYLPRLLPVLLLVVTALACGGDSPAIPDTGSVELDASLQDPGLGLPPDPPPVVLHPPAYDPPDTTDDPDPTDDPPPDPVSDLQVVAVGGDRLVLTWTTPQDRGGSTGRVDGYDLRFARPDQLTLDVKDRPADVTVPAPDLPGLPEQHVLAGLDPDTDYFVNLRSRDELGQYSEWSSTVVHHTFPHSAPPSLAGIIGAGNLIDPVDVSVADDGEIAVLDAGGNRVRRFSSEGVLLGGFDLPSIHVGLSFDTDGTIVVVSSGGSTRFGADDLPILSGRGGNDVDVSASGRVAVASGGGAAILTDDLSTESYMENWVGIRYPYPRTGNIGIAWSGTDSIHVAFTDRTLILLPDMYGDGLKVTYPDQTSFVPARIGGDPLGPIYLVNRNVRNVVILDHRGLPAYVLPVEGAAPLDGTGLGGVDPGPDGTLYVVDRSGGLVRMYAYQD